MTKGDRGRGGEVPKICDGIGKESTPKPFGGGNQGGGSRASLGKIWGSVWCASA